MSHLSVHPIGRNRTMRSMSQTVVQALPGNTQLRLLAQKALESDNAERIKAKMNENDLLALTEAAKADGSEDCVQLPLSLIPVLRELVCSDELEAALSRTKLHFIRSPSKDDDSSRAQFRERMEKLRLRDEERKYSKMTSSVHKVASSDDVTTRSMTYAASVGLNMIVAPLSFGCFMYFFSGGILDRFVPAGNNEVKRVIIGVISGVVMLFIEMILYVIRTHEMEKALRKKAHKSDRGSMPFGRYSAAMERNYCAGD